MLNVLADDGCSRQSIAAFRKAVENYYSTGFDFSFAKFPQSQNGFYTFSSVQQLAAALPQRLPDTQHDYYFNCFDTVIVLASDRMKVGLKPDECFGPFMVTTVSSNIENIAFAATARDVFTAIYPLWYREETESVFPESTREKRVCLTPAIASWHILPMTVREETLDSGVLNTLRASWQLHNLKYPQQFEVVLCHKVDLSSHTTCTPHAGLLFHRKTGFIYLEKAGGKGPFVRLDFDNMDDLDQWLSAVFEEQEHKSFHLFATFNDTKIVNLNLQ